MDNARATRVIREIPKALIFGLLGYFLGVSGGEGVRAVEPAMPTSEIGSSVQPQRVEEITRVSGETRLKNNDQLKNGHELKREVGVEAEDVVVSPESTDLEERILNTLSPDESIVMQEGERLPDAESSVDSMGRLHEMTADEQLKYVKAIGENQDDASIVELKDLILFDDQEVRRAAIDTLIDIMGQETGHYSAIDAMLTENFVFMDDEQISKVNKISSKVASRGKTKEQ
jgi:hypothetical protein